MVKNLLCINTLQDGMKDAKMKKEALRPHGPYNLGQSDGNNTRPSTLCTISRKGPEGHIFFWGSQEGFPSKGVNRLRIKG